MITFNQILKSKKSQRSLKAHKVKSTALAQSPQKRGVCFKITTMSPKKPNSAVRKIAKVRLSTGRKVVAYICGQGHTLQEHSVVLIRGGKVPDLPGVKYKLVKGKLDFSWHENVRRHTARSKYGIKKTAINLK